jgi:hypothetical protein
MFAARSSPRYIPLVSDEILLILEHVVEDEEDSGSLLLIPLNCTGDLLLMKELEPGKLPIVWSLVYEPLVCH